MSAMVIVLVLLLVTPQFTFASDQPILGTKLRIRTAPAVETPRVVFRSVDEPAINPAADPTSVEATFSLTELQCGTAQCFAGPGTGQIVLDPAHWSARGTPAGSKGYRYRDPTRSRGGVQSARFEPGRLVVRAVGGNWPWVPGTLQSVLAEFQVGDERYCSVFGGTRRRHEAGNFWFKHAAAPAACPAVCGNDRRESDEACDGTDDLSCAGLCAPDCTCPAAVCGNAIVEVGETCDGSAFGLSCLAGHPWVTCGSDCGCCAERYGCTDTIPCCSTDKYCGPPRSTARRCLPYAQLEDDCGAGYDAPCAPRLACVGEYMRAGHGVAGRCLAHFCNGPSDCAAGEECINQFPAFGPGQCAEVACTTDADCLRNETCTDGSCCGGPGAFCDTIGGPFPWRNCCTEGTACISVGAFPTCIPNWGL